MREQVVTPRAGRAAAPRARKETAAAGGQGAGQRPASRKARPASSAAAGKGRQRAFTWRSALAVAPAVGKAVLAVCVGLLVFAGYRAAASASFFQLKTVEVEGAARASRDEIKGMVARAVGADGVWNSDLEELSHGLRELQWVRAAYVQRVLPSGVRVRVVEREPRMVARNAAGRLYWVDEEGVALGPAAPDEGVFFLRGLEEDGDDGARRRNRERMALVLRLKDDWEKTSLSERVSEVNLHDLRDVRVQLAGGDSEVEVRLGGDHAELFRSALKTLDEKRQTPLGQHVNYIVMIPGKAPVFGYPASLHPSAVSGATATGGEVETKDEAGAAPRGPTPPADPAAARGAERRKQTAPRKKEKDKRDAATGDAPRGAVRERRVG
ncbi:MAG TPA: FtsQ-type POTRA domain-containing protein [Pyrinomonadaceae bacterium]